MRTHFYLLCLFFVFSRMAQSQSVVSLYRGWPNQVDLGEFGDSSRYSYVCSVCEISWSRASGQALPPGTVLLRPGFDGSSISLLVRDKSTKKAVKTFSYRLSNRADYVLMLDDIPMGEAITAPPSRIHVDFPKDFGLSTQAMVASWAFSIPGANGQPVQGFSGTGEMLSEEAARAIFNAPPDSAINFIATVFDPEDGISRKMAGAWKR